MNVLRSMRTILLAAVLALPAALMGCCIFPVPSHHTGNRISDQQIKTIQPGKTTKQEIIALFGAPMGIAVQGEATTVLAPTEYRYGPSGIQHRGSREVQADTLFELFSVRHSYTDYDRIYYYYDASSSKIVYWFLFYVYESGNTKVDQLWVLMNEKTGIVEDYVYRQHP